VLWEFDANSRETLLEARLDGSAGASVSLPRGDVRRPDDFDQRWSLGGRWLELDGDGIADRVGPQVGDVLPSLPGLEKFEIESNANRDGPAIARLFTREAGNWVERWKRPQDPTEDWTTGLVAASVPIAGDFDGDGRNEIAFQGFHWVYVIDAESGALEAKTRFLNDDEAESGRGYGWFGAHDFDGDGKSEFVIIGDTQNLVAVLGWDDQGKLYRRWIKIINFDAYQRISVVKPGVDPLHDIDGKSGKEIVFCIYNYDPSTGALDNQWHVWALDGLSGEAKLDLKGHVLSGLRDLDGDGVSEILATEAPELLVPKPSKLTVYSFKNGVLAPRWQSEGDTFQLARCDALPLWANSSAAGEPLDLLSGPVQRDGPPVFFTRRVVDPLIPTVRINAWQSDDEGTIREIGHFVAPSAEVLAVRPAVDEEANVLLRVRASDEATEALAEGISAHPVASSLTGAPMSPVSIARLAPNEKPSVVVEGAIEQIIAFTPYDDAHTARWRRPGRGMSTGGGHSIGWSDRGGIVLADLQGDGTLATIAATTGPVGQARLVAYDPRGEESWHRDFNDVPGEVPAHNVAGLTMWFSGRFTDSKRYDIFATPRPKSQEEGVLLSGLDGSIAWRRQRVGPGGQGDDARPVGGTWLASSDYNGDGRDDVVGMYPDLFYVLEGKSGDLLVSRDSSAIFPGAPIKPYNAMPVVAKFGNDGTDRYLWGACDRAFGLLDRAGDVIWEEDRPLPRGPGILPGVGDIDGDGRLEALVVGCADGGANSLICYSGSTGDIQWKLPLPGDVFVDIFQTEQTPMPPATADLNGDGRDECVFTIGTTIYAVSATADGLHGLITWQLDLPGSGRLGPPAIADVSGTGQAQVVVMGRDGIVYGVGDIRDPVPK